MPPERVLIVGLTGRSLAQSAHKAGMAPIVLDAFADLDTREAAEAWMRVPLDRDWSFKRRPLLAAAAHLAPPPIPLVWGSGLERHLDLLGDLAQGRALLSNEPSVVARIKDPLGFAASCARLAIPHPDIRTSFPEEPQGWLVKRRGGAGGSHVKDASGLGELPHGHYLQRRVGGRPVSVLLLGDGRQAIPLCRSEQWADRRGSFRFAGVVTPAGLEAGTGRLLDEAACAIAGHYGLKGLASADFLLEEDGAFHLLEINPRPGASLEACEAALGRSLFALHAQACRGRLPRSLPGVKRAAATRIHYARHRLLIPAAMRWPAWAGDRSPGGTLVQPGSPVCTLRATADDAQAARSAVESRAEAIEARFVRLPEARLVTRRRSGRAAAEPAAGHP